MRYFAVLIGVMVVGLFLFTGLFAKTGQNGKPGYVEGSCFINEEYNYSLCGKKGEWEIAINGNASPNQNVAFFDSFDPTSGMLNAKVYVMADNFLGNADNSPEEAANTIINDIKKGARILIDTKQKIKFNNTYNAMKIVFHNDRPANPNLDIKTLMIVFNGKNGIQYTIFYKSLTKNYKKFLGKSMGLIEKIKITKGK
jgi:hypothetical protein